MDNEDTHLSTNASSGSLSTSSSLASSSASSPTLNPRPVLVIVGEKSGEEHAMSFIPSLVNTGKYQFFGVGGDDLAALGMDNIYHLKDFSSMGFTEVIAKIFFYLKALKKIEQEVVRRQCHDAILVDFQGFNLKLAKRLKKINVNVYYYVAPQAWVWKPWRAQVLADSVQTLFTLLPFEKKWFSERKVTSVISVAHPLFLKYEKILPKVLEERIFPGEREFNIILLPGSRRGEVQYHLPIMKEVVRELKKNKKVKVGIVRVAHLASDFYKEIDSIIDYTYQDSELAAALTWADLALAASGTVTLATGLFALPTVVIYKASWINVFILRRLIKYTGAVSLTNIILNKNVFPELLIEDATPKMILPQLNELMKQRVWEEIVDDCKKLSSLTQGEGVDVSGYLEKKITTNSLRDY